jgi:riboflavin kinase/FMN adenylyltransferase
LGKLAAASGVTLEVVEPLEIGGKVVSSSRVRELISRGAVGEACELLTAPYRVRGMVVHGAGRGATIGFPTANLDAIDTLLPAPGVYAGRALVDGRLWPAAIHIGPNPTFGEGRLKVEAHLVDFSGPLYHQPLEIDFLARLRNVERFGDFQALVTQLQRDVEQSRAIVESFSEAPRGSSA